MSSSASQDSTLSKLSAEAECFVPSSSMSASSSTNTQGAASSDTASTSDGATAGTSSGSSATAGAGRSQDKNDTKNGKKLPKYMTSCYPFVQGDPGPPPRLPGSWQNTGRPPPPHGNVGGGNSSGGGGNSRAGGSTRPQRHTPAQNKPRQHHPHHHTNPHHNAQQAAAGAASVVPTALPPHGVHNPVGGIHGIPRRPPAQAILPHPGAPFRLTVPPGAAGALHRPPHPSAAAAALLNPALFPRGAPRGVPLPPGAAQLPPSVLSIPPDSAVTLATSSVRGGHHDRNNQPLISPNGNVASLAATNPHMLLNNHPNHARAASPTPSQASTYRTGSTPSTPQGYMSPTPAFVAPNYHNSLGWSTSGGPPGLQPIGTAPSAVHSMLQQGAHGHVYPPRFNGSLDCSEDHVLDNPPAPTTKSKKKSKKKKDSGGGGSSSGGPSGGGGGAAGPSGGVGVSVSSKMVSVGVQQETGALTGGAHKNKKRSKPKTMILMDASNQTDFAESIANLTLKEQGNSLYTEHRTWHDPYENQSYDSSDSEEVDSDSGYSSPLHRRNHPGSTAANNPSGSIIASSGGSVTVSVSGAAASASGVSSGKTNHAPNGFCVSVADSSSKFAFPPPALGTNAVGHVYPVVSGHYGEFGGPTYPGTYVPTQTVLDSRQAVAARGAAAAAAGSAASWHASAMATSMAGATGGSSGFVLDNYEDFPDLTTPPSASHHSSHLSHYHHQHHPSVLSHNQSSLSQDSSRILIQNPNDKHQKQKETKESKAVRKRRKRREAADRAAEKELAEITLEQELLRSNQQLPPTQPALHGAVDGSMGGEDSSRAVSYSDAVVSGGEADDVATSDGAAAEAQHSATDGTNRNRKTPPPPGSEASSRGGGSKKKKSQQPVTLNMADMMDALERQKFSATEDDGAHIIQSFGVMQARNLYTSEKITTNNNNKKSANPLDSSAPLKRGKEREVPKAKKPSPLKKVILKEREEKKLLRLMDDSPSSISTLATMSTPASISSQAPPMSLGGGAGGIGSSGAGTPSAGEEHHHGGGDYSSQDQYPLSGKSSSLDLASVGGGAGGSSVGGYSVTSPGSADSPISQSSPFSMSPLSGGSPMSSGVTSPNAAATALPQQQHETSGNGAGAGGGGGVAVHGTCGGVGGVYVVPTPGATDDGRTPGVMLKIHSRRFREYCTQVLDREIDQSCTRLLQDLVRFQDRVYHKDQNKAKSKRRIVLGLREVTKHLRNCKIKCVMMSPNLERIQSKGGLDEALNQIIYLANQQDVPVVFALGRRALGRACNKIVPVSVVGIFNYEGAEEHFRAVMSLSARARQAYKDMVESVEKEAAAIPVPVRGASGYPQLYSHMGHSRTPSACSAISFTSSILSEPISENYPHSEPETDSRGYEIVRDGVGHVLAPGARAMVGVVSASPAVASAAAACGSGDNDASTVAKGTDTTAADACDDDNDSIGDKETVVNDTGRDDDDDDDDGDSVTSCDTGPTRPEGYKSSDEDSGAEDSEDDAVDEDEEDEDDELDEAATTEAGTTAATGAAACNSDEQQEPAATPSQNIPHIDSVHSSIGEMNSEILSQHSSKAPTVDTVVANGPANHTDATVALKPAAVTVAAVAGDRGAGKDGSILDKQRIESWVAETQQQHLSTMNNNTTTSTTACATDSCSSSNSNSDNECSKAATTTTTASAATSTAIESCSATVSRDDDRPTRVPTPVL